MNELTITLTGSRAEAYTSTSTSFTELRKDNTKIIDAYEDAVLKYDNLVDEHIALKAELADLVIQLDEATAEELDDKGNQSIACAGESPSCRYTDSSEKGTTTSEVIEPNPVSFPAVISNKPKSGTHWTENELKVIKRSLKANYTLAFLKVKLSNRSEAAIRSMLLNYSIGVKNNKLYTR